jgi:hypothetical protein
MIRLITVDNPPTFAPPKNLSDYPGVTFHVAPAGGVSSEADYFAIPPDDPCPGRTELILVFNREQSPEKIEELRKLLENRINIFTGMATWFVQITEAVTEDLDGYDVVAHSSYVPD